MDQELRGFDALSRRAFVTRAARTCLGVGLAPWWASSASTVIAAHNGKAATKAIYLFMSGGMSHLDTFDPKPKSEAQGPTKSIATSLPGIRVSEHLPKLAAQANRFSLVRSMTSTQGAHAPGRYLARTSYSPRSTIRHPGLGSWVTNLTGTVNHSIPGNVVIGGGSDHPGAGFMDLKYAPLPIGDPAAGLQNAELLRGVTEADFRRRLQLVAKFGNQFLDRYPHKKVKGYGEMYAEAIRLMRSDDVKAFDISAESKKLREKYGGERFGQGCLLARRLIERDVRFVEVEFGGWDTHNDNFETLAEKAPVLDQAVSALLDDLSERGLLQETLVVVTSEFGRSPKINERTGRDHHPAAYSSLLAGVGIKRGYVHGASDERGHNVEEDEVTVPDLNATIAKALSVPVDETVLSSSKRPFKVANDGVPVAKLFG